MKLRHCSSCHEEKRVSEFREGTKGRGFKTCNECRRRKRKYGDSPDYQHPTHRGKYKVRNLDEGETCADCSRELTRNRTILLDGDYLCLTCRRARFKGADE